MQLKFTQKYLRSFAVRIGVMVLVLTFSAKTAQAQVLYSEGWNVVSPLPAGWASQQLSSPIGALGWFQGNAAVFPAQTGAATAYLAANFNNTGSIGTISNWMFAPTVNMTNGDLFTFWTRVATGGGVFPDRLQVRISPNGTSTNVGTTATSVGDYSILLLDINPTYSITAYPEVWTQFTVTVSGLAAPNTSGRIAFRYFVENAGLNGANSNFIGIDEVVYTKLPACSGTPAVGNTQSTASPVCPNASFTLSTQTPLATGLTYQWQSSLTGVPASFTNIPGATAATYTTSQTVATYYRAIVTCGANTATSTPLQLTMNGFNSCYCLPTYSNGCTLGDYIANVKLGSLNNTTICTGQFTYYNALPAPDVYPGASNTLSVSVGPDTFGQWVGAWIDYNQDGIFSPSEFLATPVNAGASGTVNFNFTVPATATLGTTRMRIRAGDDLAMTAAQSCGASNSTFGEAEDYNINITPCIQGVFTTQPASTSAQCASNATFTVAATGSALSYSWEYRINASSPWLNVPNAAPYSGVTTNTLTISNVSSAMTGYQYRALMSGPCTAIDASAVATLTVTPLVAAVSPVSATICVGSIQQLTLTNASSPVTQTFTATTGLPLAIPDATLAGINNSIPVTLPALSIISNINVKFSIPAHTWPGDLVIVLRAPNGKVLNLDYGISSTGAGPGAGMVNTVITATAGAPLLSSTTAPYTGTFRPDAQMTPTASMGNAPVGPTGFNAAADLVNNFTALYTQTNGNWTLAIYDAFGGDVGSLTAWSMDITYGAPAAGVWTASPATPNTMFINAGATTPYVAGSLANTIWVNPTVNTSYSVVYSTPTPCTSAPTVIPVTVVSPVSAVVNPVNRAACVGGSTTFSVSATGGPLTYQWQVTTDGGVNWTNIAGATSATYTVTNVTTAMHNYRYRAVITAAPCVGSTTTTAATLTVNSLPVVTLSAPDLALTPGQLTTITGTSSPAAVNWSWTLNGAAISGTANTQVVGIDGLGTYQARVTDANGCINTSGVLTIGAEAALDRLWIYPNPNDGVFQVRLYYGGPLTERRVVSIFKSNGQLVMEKEFTLDNITNPYLRMDFDLSTQAGGTYVVKVYNRHTGKTVSGLVVIQ